MINHTTKTNFPLASKKCERYLPKSDQKVYETLLLYLSKLLTESDQKVHKNLPLLLSKVVNEKLPKSPQKSTTLVIQWTFVGDTMTLEMVIRRWDFSV